MFRQFYRRHQSRLVAIAAFAATSLLMGLLQAGPGDPQPVETEGRIIDRVDFEGLKTVAPGYAQGVARIAPGSKWDRDEIAGACARLAATGKFEGAPYAEAREEGERLIVVFVVRERPFITQVDFVGNAKFKASELLKDTQLSAGSPINEFLLSEAKRAIERKYREAGYAHATVEIDRQVLADEQRVLFRVSEGPRVKIRKIVFEGNAAFSDRRLSSKIETATYIWIFRTGAFDEETVQRDVAALKQYYVDRGYLNAEAGYRVEVAENGRDMTVVFQISEGRQHFIRSIRYGGNTVFDNDRIASFMKSAVGSPIDADVLKADRQKIVAEYGTLGYIYAEVTTTHVFDEEDGYVHLTVQVQEGEQYRLGRIEIRGNRRTKDKVVRRELRFYPEELYDSEEAKRAEQRLVETRLFSEATITPQGETPGVRDALVEVAEADSTTILFGVGVTSNSGIVGSISIEQRNFDLFDTPRSMGELFKGRSFRGAGQTLRLTLEPGTELNRGRIEFREPYLMDRDIGLGLGAYVFERQREEYDESRIGFYTSFDKRWREGLLKDWAAEAAFRFEQVDISGTDWLTADEIKDDKGGHWLTSIKGTLVRDKTDSRWLPSEGNRTKVAWEQFGAMGGDYTFSRVTGEFDQYWTVRRDTFDRKHIVQVGGNIGQIFGDAPVFEKFHGGGIGSIRGFEYRGISPRAGWRKDRIGGDFQLLTNAQYSFPLVGDTLRGVTFVDMGTVEDDFGISSWRASAGIGLRLYIKYFGPIPMSFDLGFPIAKNGEDDTQIFSFSFGTTF
jgi:outer membrane protein assembly complex protein YaeT